MDSSAPVQGGENPPADPPVGVDSQAGTGSDLAVSTSLSVLAEKGGVPRSKVDQLLDEADEYYQGKIQELQAALRSQTARGEREDEYKRAADERHRALVAKETELMRVREAAAREKQQLEAAYDSHMMKEIGKAKTHYKQAAKEAQDQYKRDAEERQRALAAKEAELELIREAAARERQQLEAAYEKQLEMALMERQRTESGPSASLHTTSRNQAPMLLSHTALEVLTGSLANSALHSKMSFKAHYTEGRQLGEGAFGRVVEATDRHTGQTVAAKFQWIRGTCHHPNWDPRQTLSEEEYGEFIKTEEDTTH
ncbi:hypothetical protein KIPB_009814 [Kipferlia bialata]|uniref:Protein kinase domain-containing protein n=1 Tax=Kipferlia bialata TaxID=797122 RepID=A0A9K3GLX3_9EUKA|nr:hypothetical protein KIPB_009814 [Kipferlia bialata]|eukprot:g9814.t1